MLFLLGGLFFTVAFGLSLLGIDAVVRREVYAERARLRARIEALRPERTESEPVARRVALSTNPLMHYGLGHIPRLGWLRDQLAYAAW